MKILIFLPFLSKNILFSKVFAKIMLNYPRSYFFESNEIIDDGICKLCTSQPKDLKAISENIGNSME